MKRMNISSGVAGLLLLTLLVGFPIALFRRALFQRGSATLVLNANDRNDVALGRDIVIDIDHVPDGWSGAIAVNSAQRFPFRSKSFRLSATPANGFKRSGVNDLIVVLRDRSGVSVPIKGSDGHYQIVTVPNVVVRPETQIVEAEPHSRTVGIEARLGYSWAVSGLPMWITIRSGASGTGDGKVDYDVQANTSNEARSAHLMIGDASFEIQQPAPVAVQIPYRERFSEPPSPIWMLDNRDHGGGFKTGSRWFLDEQPGRQSTATVEPGGPGGSNSLIIQSSQTDPRPWATLLELPEIAVETDARYVVTMALKAEVPGPVTISFARRSSPYQNCGLSQTLTVTKAWTDFTVPFRVTGVTCGARENRLAFGTASMAGKLWIANVSLELGPAGPPLGRR